jgi:hypothetical protein
LREREGGRVCWKCTLQEMLKIELLMMQEETRKKRREKNVAVISMR